MGQFGRSYRSGFALCAIALAGTLASLPAIAAKLEPPSEYLRAANNTLVAAELVALEGAERAVFEVSELIYGPETGQRVTLRLPAWVAAQLERKQSYLVVYTAYTFDPRSAKVVVVNPDGPLLLTGPAVEPALFRDTPAARAVLGESDRAALADEQHRHAAVAGLAHADAQWRNYYAGELALRKPWHVALQSRDRDAIATLVRDRDAPPVAREMLLRAAAADAAHFGSWWRDAALDVLATAPVRGHLEPASRDATLVQTAFDALREADAPIPLVTLTRWTRSDSAALVESALLAARRSAPAAEERLARDALELSLLPAGTRDFLRDHLRRLELMKAAQREPRARASGRHDAARASLSVVPSTP